MKINKKFIICMSILVIILMSCISVMAHGILETSNIEVIFAEDSIFTEEDKQIIEFMFLDSDVENKPVAYGLKCTLFGHKYKSEITTVIRHKVSEYAPRCMKEYYETKICTECSDVQNELIENYLIDCCQ